jgi:putative SOS response-associated peptidase YedK
MCGRYVLRRFEELKKKLARSNFVPLELDLHPRYNVAPTQEMPVGVQVSERPEMILMKWGPLYRLFSGKPTLMVNARSESVATKPSFKSSVQQRRCLVPADGFFEWQRDEKLRVPHLFEMRDGAPFWIAGLYEEAAPDAPRSFLLLTTGPNELMAPIHDRMPVILDDESAAAWLRPGAIAKEDVAKLCVPYPANQMKASRVSSIANNARNDSPECVAPVAEGRNEAGEFRLS